MNAMMLGFAEGWSLAQHICLWILLLSITTPSWSLPSTTDKKQVHVVVSEEEFEATDHWEAVLKCNVVFDNIQESDCDIWWTHEMDTPSHEEEDVFDSETYHVLTEVLKHSSTLEIHRVSHNYSGAYICHAKCNTRDFTAKCIVLNHVATDGTQICSREDFNPPEEISEFTTGHKFAVVGSLLGVALIIIVLAVLRHLWNIRKEQRERAAKVNQLARSGSYEDDDEINWKEMQDFPLQPRKTSSLVHYEDASRCVEGCGEPDCTHPKMRLPSYTEDEDNPAEAAGLRDPETDESDERKTAIVMQIWRLMQSLKDDTQPELANPPSYDDVLTMVENIQSAEADDDDDGDDDAVENCNAETANEK